MKNITLIDIANKAGVSIATVSRVINNNGQVKEATRLAVTNAASELGYYDQSITTSIKNSNNTILMIIPDFENPFTASVINGVLDSVNQHGYKIIFTSTNNFGNTRDEYLDFCSQLSLSGIISLASVPNPKIIESLGNQYPMVLCSEYPENNQLSFVSIDDEKAARKATEYLLSLGRDKIALVNNATSNKYARHRQKGYIKTLNENNIEIKNKWIINLNKIDYSLAYSNIQSLLNSDDQPNAIFAVSDIYAVAAVNAIKSLNLRVPEDISVIGFDNESVSLMSVPSITTIMQPSHNIGYQSAELLFEKIESPSTSQRKVIFDTELIVRGSTSHFNK